MTDRPVIPVVRQTSRMEDHQYPTETAKVIAQRLIPEMYRRFELKQEDYGESAHDLGAAGQYAEMHRKLGKLRRAMWEGQELVGEPLDEVLYDLAGHVFLALHYYYQPELTNFPKA